MKRGMWDYLSDSLMNTLKESYMAEDTNKNRYAGLVRKVEKSLIANEIVGHEAA